MYMNKKVLIISMVVQVQSRMIPGENTYSVNGKEFESWNCMVFQ